jgi:hypothetical protein
MNCSGGKSGSNGCCSRGWRRTGDRGPTAKCSASQQPINHCELAFETSSSYFSFIFVCKKKTAQRCCISWHNTDGMPLARNNGVPCVTLTVTSSRGRRWRHRRRRLHTALEGDRPPREGHRRLRALLKGRVHALCCHFVVGFPLDMGAEVGEGFTRPFRSGAVHGNGQ